MFLFGSRVHHRPHIALGRHRLHQRRHRCVVSQEVASGTSSAKPQNDHADGTSAMQETAPSAKRNPGSHAGLQSDSRGSDRSQSIGSSPPVLVQRELDFLVGEHEQCGGFLPRVLASCQKGFSHYRKDEGRVAASSCCCRPSPFHLARRSGCSSAEPYPPTKQT